MTTAAVLLAAGAGTRFGGPIPKLLARWGAVTVLEASLSAVVDAGFAEVFVVTGAVDLPLPPSVTRVPNPAWSDGQATSLQAGIAAARLAGHDVVVVGLADQPAVTEATWRAVATAESSIAVARFAEGRRPPVRLASAVWELLPTTGDRGARDVIAAHPDLVVDVEVDGDPRDIDRPDDLVTAADLAYVEACLGRRPRAAFGIAARDASGRPAVIENPPFLDDGTPMPTRYWLVDPEASRLVGRLESAGGVDQVEAELGLDRLAEVHAAHAAGRDALIDPDRTGPRPSGGVGGTRVGVKCLHTHYAAYLAGEDDPVGEWVQARLALADPHDHESST